MTVYKYIFKGKTKKFLPDSLMLIKWILAALVSDYLMDAWSDNNYHLHHYFHHYFAYLVGPYLDYFHHHQKFVDVEESVFVFRVF